MAETEATRELRQARYHLGRAIAALLELEGAPLLVERELGKMALRLFNEHYYSLLGSEEELAEKLAGGEA